MNHKFFLASLFLFTSVFGGNENRFIIDITGKAIKDRFGATLIPILFQFKGADPIPGYVYKETLCRTFADNQELNYCGRKFKAAPNNDFWAMIRKFEKKKSK